MKIFSLKLQPELQKRQPQKRDTTFLKAEAIFKLADILRFNDMT